MLAFLSVKNRLLVCCTKGAFPERAYVSSCMNISHMFTSIDIWQTLNHRLYLAVFAFSSCIQSGNVYCALLLAVSSLSLHQTMDENSLSYLRNAKQPFNITTTHPPSLSQMVSLSRLHCQLYTICFAVTLVNRYGHALLGKPNPPSKSCLPLTLPSLHLPCPASTVSLCTISRDPSPSSFLLTLCAWKLELRLQASAFPFFPAAD